MKVIFSVSASKERF